MPSWGIRSRRLRWRGARRRRGLAMPAARRIRRTLTRLSAIPSALGEQLGEVAVVGAVVARPGEGTDPLPGRLVDPARRRPPAVAVDEPGRALGSMKRRLSRQTERSRQAEQAAASDAAARRRPAFVSTHARRCSIVVIVIVSLIAGD